MSKQYHFGGSNYKELFSLLRIEYSGDIYEKHIKPLGEDGYTERGICFAASKQEDKLRKFVGDSRFWSIFANEVRKIAFKKNDPRWNKRKEVK